MKALVIVVNRCQPAYLGCYGNDWLPTPAIDQLAAEGVVFDQHFIATASPLLTRVSWRTGRHEPGVHDEPDLAEWLWNAGVHTVLIGDERSPGRTAGFAKGMTEQHWIRRQRLPELEQEALLGGTVQTAIEWLQGHGQRDQWLLWLELASLQTPWDAAEHDPEALEGLEEESIEPWFDPPAGRMGEAITPEQAERLSPTYAGVVSGVDQWLGMLLDFLRQSELYKDLLLVVTSDAGLPLGEHDLVGDAGPCLYEEQAHLPMILHLPGGAPLTQPSPPRGRGQGEGGRRVQQLSQSVDLMPSLLDAFGLPIPETVQGKSLMPVARGEPFKLREYACATAEGPHSSGDRSIRTHQWHLIVPRAVGPQDHGSPRPRLFVKPDDRWEVNDVSGAHPDVAEHLELALRRFLDAVHADRLGELPPLRDTILRVNQ